MLTGLCIKDCTVPKVGRCYEGEICEKLPAKRWDKKQYKYLKHFERIDTKVETYGDETTDS